VLVAVNRAAGRASSNGAMSSELVAEAE